MEGKNRNDNEEIIFPYAHKISENGTFKKYVIQPYDSMFLDDKVLRIANDMADDLYEDYAAKTLKRKIIAPWDESQCVALARAKWDEPFGTIRELLYFCTTESLEKNRNNIINCFVECSDWIDLPVAIYLYESIAHPETKDVFRKISFDRHYNGNHGGYSNGNEREPFLSLKIGDNVKPEDIKMYIDRYFDMICSENLAKPKENHASVALVRNTLVRYLRFRYDMKPQAIAGFIEAALSRWQIFDEEVDDLGPNHDRIYAENVLGAYGAENDISKVANVLKKEVETNCFREAMKTFKNDKKKNADVYGSFYGIFRFKKYMETNGQTSTIYDFIENPHFDSSDERKQRFNLVFNVKQRLFTLRRTE